MSKAILVCLALTAGVWAQAPAAPKAVVPSKTPPTTQEADADDGEDEDLSAQLAKVRRVYIDMLTGGESALRLRDLLITSLQSSKLFIITENEAKADAVLKGAAEDTVFTDSFASSEGINARSQASLSGSQSQNSIQNSRTSSSASLGMSIGENESRRSEERKHEAIATVRLVSKNGDVIWSTTQESLGGKFLGASADVADKVAKKLAADVRLAKGLTVGTSGASGPSPVTAKPKARF